MSNKRLKKYYLGIKWEGLGTGKVEYILFRTEQTFCYGTKT